MNDRPVTAPPTHAGSPSKELGKPEVELRRPRYPASVRLLGWIGFAVFAAYYAYHLIPNLALRLRFEDALIVLRYARNLVAGNGLVFNPGEHVMGFTTPLFTVISGLFVLLGGDKAPALQNSFGVLCLLTEALLAARLLVRVGAAAAAPLVVVLLAVNINQNHLFIGMEIHLFAVLFLLSLELHHQGRSTATAVAVGLLFLTRYEGVLLAGMFFGHQWLVERRPPFKPALIALGVVSPWLLFATVYYGSPLPTTLSAKEGYLGVGNYLSQVRDYYAATGQRLLELYVGQESGSSPDALMAMPVLVVLLIAGAVYLLRRHLDLWPLVAFPLVTLISYALIGADANFRWHYFLLNVLGAVLLALGVYALLSTVARFATRLIGARFLEQPRSRDAAAVIATALVVLVLTLPILRRIDSNVSYRFEPGQGAQTLMAIGDWLQQRYEPETSLMNPSIGLLGWHSHLRIIDQAGLVTPGLRYLDPSNHTPLAQVLDRYAPDLVLVHVVDDEPDVLTPRYRLVPGFDVAPDYRLYSK